MSDERPKIKMSEEEHGALSRLATLVELLSAGQKRLEDTLVSFMQATDRRFADVHKNGELSWSKVGSLVLFALAIGSPLYTVLKMQNESALAPVVQKQSVAESERAADRAKIEVHDARLSKVEEHQTQADKEFIERNALQDERIGEEYHARHGHFPRK